MQAPGVLQRWLPQINTGTTPWLTSEDGVNVESPMFFRSEALKLHRTQMAIFLSWDRSPSNNWHAYSHNQDAIRTNEANWSDCFKWWIKGSCWHPSADIRATAPVLPTLILHPRQSLLRLGLELSNTCFARGRNQRKSLPHWSFALLKPEKVESGGPNQILAGFKEDVELATEATSSSVFPKWAYKFYPVGFGSGTSHG